MQPYPQEASQRSVSGHTSSGYTSFDAGNVSKVESSDARERMLDFTCNHPQQSTK
jgi:hypothetical protein